MIQYKKYYMPGTKEELLKTIDTIDCTYDILAGGTDLYAKEKTPFNGADAAIDISGIKEFSVIKLKKEEGLIKHFGFSFHESFVLALYALCAFLEPRIRKQKSPCNSIAEAFETICISTFERAF